MAGEEPEAKRDGGVPGLIPERPEGTQGRGGLERTRRYGTLAFLILFVAVAVLFIATIASTLAAILLGAILAAVASPLQVRIRRRLRGRSWAAATITVLVVLALLLPIGGLVFALVERLADALGSLSAHGWFTSARWNSFLGEHPRLARVLPSNLGAQVASGIRFVAGSLPGVLSGLANLGIALFLVTIATYYFLRDGDWILARVEHALPLEPRHTRAILEEFRRVGRAVVFGTVGHRAAAGLTAGICYWAVGLPQPLLLGALTAVAALVPVAGTSLVLVPAAIYLAAVGQLARALLLAGLGLVLVGVMDNMVRPLLNRRGLELHPLLAFLGLFGGLATFGFSGLYLGPLAVALFVAVARIYEAELAPAAAVAPRPAERPPASTLGSSLAEALSRGLRRAR